MKQFSIRTLLLCVSAMPVYAAAPVISGVANSANNQPAIAPGTWVSIYGTNLASTTRQWGGSDFNGNNLPTKLDDVQVSVNGKPAYVYVISPTQINILCPDDTTTDQVTVQLNNAQGASNQFRVTKQNTAPAFFPYSVQGGKYAIAQIGSQFVGPPGLLGAGATTAPAKPGQTITFYATGLGPTQPAQATGQIVVTSAPLANPIQITFGGTPSQIQYAGLVGSGLYQINVTVPSSASGDVAVVLTAGGQSANTTVAIEASNQPTPPKISPVLTGCVSGQVNSISYATARLFYGQAEEISIGGTILCAACAVKPPLFPEFAQRLETALRRRKNVQACYDNTGQIYQLLVSQP